MLILDYFRLSWRSIWERKGRTVGSIVGIVIALLALGIAMSVGEGFKQIFLGTFASIFGVNVIYVIPSGKSPLTDADIRLLESLPHVTCVIPIAYTSAITYIGGTTMYVYVIGVSEEYLPRLLGAARLEDVIVQGTPALAPGTALVGYYIAFTITGEQRVFPGQRIILETRSGKYIVLTVSGILQASHITAYGNPNTAVFVDYNTFFELFSRKRKYALAVVYVDSVHNVERVLDTIRKLLPSCDVFNPAAILESFRQFVMGVEIFLAFISGISMLIVGLWMFDTMTISVLQRTREIGIMKAIGFTNRQIFMLVLFEAIVISIVGVVIGDVLLYICAPYVKLSMGPSFAIPAVLTPWILVMVSVLPLIVNIIAALAPAYRAAKITPLQAIRVE